MQEEHATGANQTEREIWSKDCECKNLLGRGLCLGVPGSSSTKGNQKITEKKRGPFQITEVNQGGRFYRLCTGRAAHYENIKPHNASSEYWCIPADMHAGDYLIVDPACEVNERGTRDKNDGSEVVDNCDLPLDLELTERVEVEDETFPNAEEDWDRPEQTEVDKGVQPDFPFTMETRQSKRGKSKKKYNP